MSQFRNQRIELIKRVLTLRDRPFHNPETKNKKDAVSAFGRDTLYKFLLTVEYPNTFRNFLSGKCSMRPPPRHSVSNPSAWIGALTSS